MKKTKVFISSIINGYIDRRDVVEEAIQNLNLTSGFNFLPIRVENIKYPSMNKSSQQTWKDELLESKIYVGIYPKDKYGRDDSPIAISPTEEEFDFAIKNKKIILIFIEDSKEIHPRQKIFLKKVEDYKGGQYRTVFAKGDFGELKYQIQSALLMLNQITFDLYRPDFQKSILKKYEFINCSLDNAPSFFKMNQIIQLDLIDEKEMDTEKKEKIVDNQKKFTKEPSQKHFTISQVVSNHSRVLIVGNPGTGKSTLLQWLTYSQAQQNLSRENNELIPIIVELKWYKNNLMDLIISFLVKNDIPCYEEQVENWLKNRGFLLILDGFDEVSNTSDCLKDIKKIVEFSDNNRFIIASRKQDILSIFSNEMQFQTFTINELSNKQIENFVENYLGKENSDGFFRDLERLNTLQELRNPLILWFTLMEYSKNNDSSSGNFLNRDLNRGLLFERIFKRLRNWEKKELTQTEIEEIAHSTQHQVLSRIAFQMIQSSDSVKINKRVVREIIRPFFQNGRENYDDIVDACLKLSFKSKILVQNDSEISFWLKSYRDFFAALELKEIYSINPRQIIKMYSNKEWEDSILFFIGLIDNPSKYVKSLIQSPYWIYFLTSRSEFPFKLSLASKSIGENKEIDENIQQKVINQLDKILFFTKPTFIFFVYGFPFRYAIAALGETRSKKAIPVLKKIIEGQVQCENYCRKDVQKFGVKTLKKIPSIEVQHLLYEMAFREEKLNIQSEIVSLLGEIYSEDFEKIFVQILKNKTESLNRRRIALRILIGGLTGEDDIRFNSLKKKYQDDTISIIVDIALFEDDKNLKDNALDFLSNAILENKESRIIRPIIFALQNNPDPFIRKRAVYALIYQRTSESRNALFQALDDESAEVRRSSAFYLRYNGPITESEENEVAIKLKNRFHDTDICVRYWAIEAFRVIRNHPQDEEIMQLIKFLDDDMTIIRNISAFCLGWIKSPAALDVLKKRIDTEKYELPRATAIWATIRIDPSYENVVKENFWELPYIIILQDNDLNKVYYAVKILRKIGTEYSLKFLQEKYNQFFYSDTQKNADYELGQKLRSQLHYAIYDIKERSGFENCSPTMPPLPLKNIDI